ncbi:MULTISPECIES: TfuA-like protein [Sinorhizobium]|uniref:TfuA-like protein n=1 Tax=Sinorhizobium TaxID=28105 RepID=UPI000BE848D2|nr:MULTISPECIES: TfuA-like protein [Sinorhizobium]PDT54617.1 TfuA domain-containing protein [Sinorhizobium sp. NG07B]POH31665.1 TfuA domain-containing protein [Sinorhizobium americanum]
MASANDDGPILVFLGPTLRLAEAQAALDAIYLKPVAQGDIVLAAHAFRPRAMLLIDGLFEDRPAVRHKEILWAMAQGITMIGAASMGALRAAELCDFGMIGVGLIYRWYRRCQLAADDAVAVHSAPAELGFLPLTDSLVDLQRTFSSLSRRGLISPAERCTLTTMARDMNFRERTLAAALERAGWSTEQAQVLRRAVVRQKELDALSALHNARALAQKARGAGGNMPWIATNTFIRDLEAGGIDSNLVNTYKLNP